MPRECQLPRALRQSDGDVSRSMQLLKTGTATMQQPLSVPGIRLGVAEAGIKYAQRRDLVLIEAAPGTQAAAVFTQNAFCAAPVQVARAHLQSGAPRYLLINTGNANAGTGAAGLDAAQASCQAVADLVGCAAQQVLPFSTGVIGEALPLDRLIAGLPAAHAALRADAWVEAAHGIMTTDTKPKWATQRLSIGGHMVTITGIAKGSGMICPNMATMLGFIATDAQLEQSLLQTLLNDAVRDSFNAITVDGDTSTNDALLLLATGQAPVRIAAGSAEAAQFSGALRTVCATLAQAIVRDGEGATKFITVQVQGGRDGEECRQVAYTIAHSPLVKTALFASDPNWGRILAAVGRAGVAELEIAAVQIYLDEVCVVRDGGRNPAYAEEQGQQVMARPEITIRVELGRGAAQAQLWTTDLSFDYVRINAEYRS